MSGPGQSMLAKALACLPISVASVTMLPAQSVLVNEKDAQ